MSGRDRNAPCPCGSGKKLKKCCIDKPGPKLARYTTDERNDAMDLLEQILLGDDGDAATALWDVATDLVFPDGEPDEAELSEEDRGLFEELLDYRLTWVARQRKRNGDSIAKSLAAEPRSGLSPGARAYLLALDAAEDDVVSIEGPGAPGKARLRSLLVPDRTYEVLDDGIGGRRNRDRVFLARILPVGPSGGPEHDGPLMLLPSEDAEGLLAEVATWLDTARTSEPDMSPALALRHAAAALLGDCLPDIVPQSAPDGVQALRTLDGEAMRFLRVTFAVEDRATAVAALNAIPDLAPTEPDREWSWAVPYGETPDGAAPDATDDDLRRSLGRVAIEGETLVLECLAASRADRLQALVAEAAGAALRLLGRTERTMDEVLREANDRGAPFRTQDAPAMPSSGVPPEVEAEVVGRFMARHYAAWPDTALPALGGQTPREAAADPQGQGRVIELLRDMERGEAFNRSQGRYAFDFTPVWETLGLTKLR